MKKSLFIIATMFLCSVSYADMGTAKYRSALQKCDTEKSEKVSVQSATNDLKQTSIDTSNCYVKIGRAVIDEYYTDTASDMEKKFIDFSNAIYAASLKAYSGPDECYPECGQVSETMRMDMTESYIKKYITDILDYIDMMDI